MIVSPSNLSLPFFLTQRGAQHFPIHPILACHRYKERRGKAKATTTLHHTSSLPPIPKSPSSSKAARGLTGRPQLFTGHARECRTFIQSSILKFTPSLLAGLTSPSSPLPFLHLSTTTTGTTLTLPVLYYSTYTPLPTYTSPHFIYKCSLSS